LRFSGKRLAAVALLVLANSSITASVSAEERRYASPSGAFSISMENFWARGYSAGKEVVLPNALLTDFSLHSVGLALIDQRCIEWVRTDEPITPALYEQRAGEAVDGYLEGRFGAGTFVVLGRGSIQSESRPVLTFAARGRLNSWPADWQGVVVFFDGGIALVSQVVAQPTTYTPAPVNGITNQQLVDWALTLRPGK
jgi:hypothetical protein